ncbi:MAG TPA: alkaline phosphatase PafA [Flavisolibacter sp.]|nr:alkaline phosphatase PafA [Flavisolibacter sp.]
MKKFVFYFLLLISISVSAQNLQRPKLVVGIVVDQMRWDYLYRYYDRYSNDGFKRLLNGGFSCENTFINHLPSVTGVGHATIYTGSVPSIHGIAGNEWTDQWTGKTMYCVSDSTVLPIGNATSTEGKMSPRNLLTTTITDELRMATNFRSKVVGVSLKDRASILPAGHTPTAAYWLDDATGNFITSTYYMEQLPDWVNRFNSKKRIEQLIANGWNTLYPINTYKQSDADAKSYEGLFAGETSPVFPHDIKAAYARSKGSFRNTPFGNTLTSEFAVEALNAYGLGKGEATDFLAINFASTDYVGHMFGPNAIEVEDTYLRLDKTLAELFKTLDTKVGKGQWLLFLTADHAAAHAIGYMKEHNLPADAWRGAPLRDSLNRILSAKFGTTGLVRSITNYQVNFDLSKIASADLDFNAIRQAAVDFLQRQPGISYAVDMAWIGRAPVPEKIKTMMVNGYNFKRSGQLQIVLNAGWFDAYSRTGTTHGTWNPFDTHIPLIWYGWNIKCGVSNREIHMQDIAPTLAALLRIQMPNGSIGNVIEEVASPNPSGGGISLQHRP